MTAPHRPDLAQALGVDCEAVARAAEGQRHLERRVLVGIGGGIDDLGQCTGVAEARIVLAVPEAGILNMRLLRPG
ncbi:MAG: hypothetical protein CVT80_14090, partial [Alphaproteobacteria bacterium HGW-Alphaproteobacteria-2]